MISRYVILLKLGYFWEKKKRKNAVMLKNVLFLFNLNEQHMSYRSLIDVHTLYIIWQKHTVHFCQKMALGTYLILFTEYSFDISIYLLRTSFNNTLNLHFLFSPRSIVLTLWLIIFNTSRLLLNCNLHLTQSAFSRSQAHELQIY